MKNYKDQTPRFRCANCNHRIENCMPDEYSEYGCGDDPDGKPPLTWTESVAQGREYDWEAWETWINRNRVSENGICEHYEAT